MGLTEGGGSQVYFARTELEKKDLFEKVKEGVREFERTHRTLVHPDSLKSLE